MQLNEKIIEMTQITSVLATVALLEAKLDFIFFLPYLFDQHLRFILAFFLSAMAENSSILFIIN